MKDFPVPLRPLTGLVLFVMGACYFPGTEPAPAPATLPPCDSGLVGIRTATLQDRTTGQVTDLILDRGWVADDRTLLVVVLDEPPTLRNPREVAEAIQRSYPSELREQGVGGTAEFALLVDGAGAVIDAALLEESGHPELDRAGEDAVRQAAFTPAVYRGCRPFYWTTLRATFAAQ